MAMVDNSKNNSRARLYPLLIFGLVVAFAITLFASGSGGANTVQASGVSQPAAKPGKAAGTDTPSSTRTIHAKALNDHGCDDSEWHFVITQVHDEASAPQSIDVTWANGNSESVDLSNFTGHTAHYSTTSNLDSQVTSASADIYGSWRGQFNLSHGPCNGSETATHEPTNTRQPTHTAEASYTREATYTHEPMRTETPEGTSTHEATRTHEPTRTGTVIPATRTHEATMTHGPTYTATSIPATRTRTVVPPTRTGTVIPITRTRTVVPPSYTRTPEGTHTHEATRTGTVIPATRTHEATRTGTPTT